MTVPAPPRIVITNTDNREIDNLWIALQFYIDGAPHFCVVQHGTFNNIATYSLNAHNGTNDGTRWTGNFLTLMGSKQSLQGAVLTIEKALVQTGSDQSWEEVNGGPMLPNITIVDNDGRTITGMQVIPEFFINGGQYTTNLGLGDWNQTYGLELSGYNGTLGSNDWWTGNFLTLKYHGVETMQDPSLRTFLNVLFIICTVANAAAAAIGAADEIRRGLDGGGASGGGWSLGQQI